MLIRNFKAINRAPLYYALTSIFRTFLSLVRIPLVTLFYDENFQGLFYLVFSFFSLQSLFEAGAGFVILRNQVSERGSAPSEKTRNAYHFFRFSTFVYGATSLVMIAIYSIEDPYLRRPEIFLPSALSVLSFAMLLNSRKKEFLAEALLPREIVYRTRLIIQFLSGTILALSLALGMGIISVFLSNILAFTYYNLKYKASVNINFPHVKISRVIFGYLKENIKICINWMAGAFYWFSLTALTFKYFGLEYVGGLGLTMAICQAISNLASSSINANRASYIRESTISGPDIVNMAKLSFWHITLSLVITSGALAFFVLTNFVGIGERLLSPPDLIFFSGYILAVLATANVGTILRYQGGEPALNWALPMYIAPSLIFLTLDLQAPVSYWGLLLCLQLLIFAGHLRVLFRMGRGRG